MGGFAIATGLLILLVPKTVQTGNPALSQVGSGDTGRFSCGSSLQYAIGHRPWEDANPGTYADNQFTTVSQVCPPRLRSNLNASLVWLTAGVAILLARWYVLRRNERHRAALRQHLGP
jgi:hypothetical protein